MQPGILKSLINLFLAGLFVNGCKHSSNSSDISSQIQDNERSAQIKQFVENNLKDKQRGSENRLWFATGLKLPSDWIVTTTDKLWQTAESEIPNTAPCQPASPGCDLEFARLSCSLEKPCEARGQECLPLLSTVAHVDQQPRTLCQYPSDPFVDKIYQLLVSAEQNLDITSLSAPTGIFHQAMINALTYLSEKNSLTKVRLLYSGEQPANLNIFQPTTKYLQRVLAGLKAKGAKLGSLHINVAWLSSPTPSWNHAKLIIVDQKIGMQGGHNLWDPDYVGLNPVQDLSMMVQGTAVVGLQRFNNLLWSFIKGDIASHPEDMRIPPLADQNFQPAPDEIPALAMGRLGYYGQQAADDGIRAMIDVARDELLLSQQDLFIGSVQPMGHSYAIDNLLRAVLRGVKLKVIQSNSTGNPLTGYGVLAPVKAYEGLITTFEIRAKREKFTVPKGYASLRSYLCSHISYSSSLYSSAWNKWPNGSALGNHSKLIIVDQAAFMIGSQNLYPSNLQEFSLAVFSKQTTLELLQKHWKPFWQASSVNILPCPD